MTQNLATKYAPKVDERFRLGSLTNSILNKDFDWTGVGTVKIYSIETADMVNYIKTGIQRYGTPAELGDTIQSLTLTQDRAFTFIVDKVNELQQQGSKNAGAALRRQLDEVVIPEVDTYRLKKLTEGALNTSVSATTKTNAFEQFLTAMETLSENKVPLVGRVAFVTPAFYKFIKLDETFIKNSDLGQEITINGQVGKIDGVPVVVAPSSYLPQYVDMIMTHSSALVAPVQLSEYKVHENPPGISGSLVEGRIIHDAFVLENKKSAVYVHRTKAAQDENDTDTTDIV